ncbi:MAG: DegT/DnrJ/EryC1/StrS aminotransferase family protein [Deltaproteobacteria bacterium]|nr:DegT/DnrJ/EryC1/StrS aminotransferase family protein [Deltaproteobacteria bacterium]
MNSTRRTEFLPFHRPSIGDAEIAEVVDTLRSGWLTMGPKTQRFEEKFAAYVGSRHAIAVNSCTAALHLLFEAIGLGPGDEVITTPYTFTATVASVLYTGATPVLVDTLAGYPNIDPQAVATRVSDRTKAIVPVHFAGMPCDMDRLGELAAGCGASLIDDAAHALPARYKGRMIGSIGRASAFSFYAGKNMTTGEGGMITTDDSALADALRIRRLHGISRDAWKRYTAEGSWYYEVEALGFKYNMTDINASLGLHQLDRLGEFQKRRHELIALYEENLAQVPGIVTPEVPSDVESAWHLYVVRLDPKRLRTTRNEVIELLKADNIGTSVHFIPAPLHPLYQQRLGCRKEDFPNAVGLYEQSISLPLFPAMADDDVLSVCRSLERIVAENQR